MSRSFNKPVSVRVFLNLFFDCFISTIKFRLSDIRERNFVSFRGWAIGVINGMLFLLNESFDQPSFIAYNKNLESVLANFVNDDQISSQIKFVKENVAEDIKFYYLLPLLEIFKVLMKGKPNQKIFRYIK